MNLTRLALALHLAGARWTANQHRRTHTSALTWPAFLNLIRK